MTKDELTPFLGRVVTVFWRDPASSSEWRPCSDHLLPSNSVTVGTLIHVSADDYLNLAASSAADDSVSDVLALPLGCVDSIVPLCPCSDPSLE